MKLPDLQDYNYELSEGRIAKFPVQPRDSSKILIATDNILQQDFFIILQNIYLLMDY